MQTREQANLSPMAKEILQNIDPKVQLPLFEAALASNDLSYLQAIIELYESNILVTSERAMIGLCVLDILDANPTLSQNKNDVTNYLCAIFNTEALTKYLRNDTKQKLVVDPYYLPNQLPFFLSPPNTDHSREQFLKHRIKEHLDAVILQKNILRLDENQFEVEANYKAAFRFFTSGASEKMNAKEKSQIQQDLYELYECLTIEAQEEDELGNKLEDELNEIIYLQQEERDIYRIFMHKGHFVKTSFIDGKMQVIPATTDGMSSHGKQDYAALVINARGEIYIATHTEDKFNHASFMSGGGILFAGEIKIDAEGQVKNISSYSGHYQPGAKAMYLCYQFLKDHGVDLSQCTFSKLNNKKKMFAFNAASAADNDFEEKLENNDPEAMSIITDITNQSMDTFTEEEFLALKEVRPYIPKAFHF